MFSCVAVTCFVASAIASAVYAAAWSEPPEVCDQNGLYYMYNDCDYEHLERINGIVAVSYVFANIVMHTYSILVSVPVLHASSTSLCSRSSSHCWWLPQNTCLPSLLSHYYIKYC